MKYKIFKYSPNFGRGNMKIDLFDNIGEVRREWFKNISVGGSINSVESDFSRPFGLRVWMNGDWMMLVEVR